MIETKLIINHAIKGIKIKELNLINNHFIVDLFITKDLHPIDKLLLKIKKIKLKLYNQ